MTPDDDGATATTTVRADGWVEVATVAEMRRYKKKLVRLGDTNVALFWHHDEPFALRNTCMHKKRHLVRGTLLGDRVICPGHQWAFELATGYERTQDACQPTFAAKVEGDAVLVHPQPRVLVEDTTWTPEQLNR